MLQVQTPLPSQQPAASRETQWNSLCPSLCCLAKYLHINNVGVSLRPDDTRPGYSSLLPPGDNDAGLEKTCRKVINDPH